MNRDAHLIFEAFANRGVQISITDHIEEDEVFSINTTVKQFDAAHVAQAFVKHAYGKYDQDRVPQALQSVLDSMQVNPYGEKNGVIQLHINEFAGDGQDHQVEARIVGQEENAEDAPAGKKRLKYDYEWVTAFLPRDLDISNRAAQEKVLDLAFKETLRLLVPDRKNPRLAAQNMFGDEDFPQEIISQYAHYQQHGFPDASEDGWYAATDEDSEARSNAQDRSVQPGGAIDDVTDVQNKSVHLLKKHGFHVNKVSNAHAEQMGGPVVYMGKRTGAMHQVAEVDPQGMINEETPEEYLQNHVHAEDAEGAAKTPYNAMTHLTQAANHIRHILQTNADDEAQVEHIIRMAQIILGPKSDHTDAEYRKMLDGLIVILNRFIIVPMN